MATEHVIVTPMPDGTLSFAAESARSSEADLEGMFDAIEEALAAHDLGLADVVRTRLFAATRADRDAASVVRFRRLAGPARCATSSYIDETRFPSGAGVRVEGWAIAGAGAAKTVVEYEPRQPPCRYVTTGDRVFCSGVTSRAEGLEAQLAEIGPRIAATLAMAGASPDAVRAWVHRSVPDGRLDGLGATIGLDGIPLGIGRCDGFSAPGKLVEVEVDAVVGR